MKKVFDFFITYFYYIFKIVRKPRLLNFPITDNCSSKCVMCNVWVDKVKNEISPDQIKNILSDNLFSKVKHVGISGGEPTLRKDLVQCIISITGSLPNIQTLSITSHGFHPKKWEKYLPEIKKACEAKDISLSVNISVDGVGTDHEEIRRIKGGWKKLNETISILKANNIKIQLQSTISKKNIYFINELQWFANSINEEIIFRKAVEIERLYNENLIDSVETNNHESSFLADFMSSDFVKKSAKRLSRLMYYKHISKLLVNNGNRTMPCSFKNEGVLLDSFGGLYPCSIAKDHFKKDVYLDSNLKSYYFGKKANKIRQNLYKTQCDKCYHDQSGPWNPFEVIKLKLLNIKFFSALNKIYLLIYQYLSIRYTPKNSKKPNHVLLIGAYGGEHVGDSAILGGVIIRLKKIQKSRNFVVLSSRPDRTKKWISQLYLNSNLNINVISYKELSNYNFGLIVYAGGPIMGDLRLIILNKIVSRFKRKKIPFIIEGVGLGPFKNNFYKYLANSLISKADKITTRDNFDYLFPKIKFENNIDPAFDYLASRAKLKKYSIRLDHLIKKKLTFDDDKNLIGLNLRPLWSKFISKNNSEINVKNEMFKLLDYLFNNCPDNFLFVYIPFNTDHYGFSDLDIIYDYKYANENKTLPLVIVDEELGTEDMISLIKLMTSLIAMRFHACIFGSALKIPVLGIDYDLISDKGKVKGLYENKKIHYLNSLKNLDFKVINEFLNKNQSFKKKINYKKESKLFSILNR